MTLAPLLNASFAIQVHAFAAMAAFALGLVQFARRKGTFSHRTFGWIWVVTDADRRDQLVLDSSKQSLGHLEPDPSPVDLHAHQFADRGDGWRAGITCVRIAAG